MQRLTRTTSSTVRYRHPANVTETQKLISVDNPTQLVAAVKKIGEDRYWSDKIVKN